MFTHILLSIFIFHLSGYLKQCYRLGETFCLTSTAPGEGVFAFPSQNRLCLLHSVSTRQGEAAEDRSDA